MLLVTVARTWGSSSQSEGTTLALRDDDVVIGSVLGGCIEDDLIDHARHEGLHYTKSEAVKYGVSAEEVYRFGLSCGDTLQLVLKPLNASGGIDALLRVMEAGQFVVRMLDMAAGAATLQHATVTDGPQLDEVRLVTIHGSRYRTLVIGVGQLSHYLCQIVVGLDYQIAVCDPREGYNEERSIPSVAMVRTMPDDTMMVMKLNEHYAVIALTHDPKFDDLTPMEALETPAFYIGVLSSRRNNANRRERPKEFDLSSAGLARLYGLVGICIGSHTPPEVATSTPVEVTAAKNGVPLPTILQVEGVKAAHEIAANAVSSCVVSQS